MPKPRVDVHGNFKLGANGTVHKGISSFSYNFIGTVTIDLGNFQIFEIPIPIEAQLQVNNYSATILATPDPNINDFAVFPWVKLHATDNKKLRIKIKNESPGPLILTGRTLHFTIHEF